MNKQSAKIGIDKLYIAEVTAETDSSITYGTPIHIPGITEFEITLNNSVTPIFADDGVYESFNDQGEIECKVPLIGLDGETYCKVTGASYSNTNGVVEDAMSNASSYFAVGFRAQKVNGTYQYVWLLKGKFNKPDMSQKTKGDGTEAGIEEYTYKVLNRHDGKWRRMLNSDDSNLPDGNTDATLSDAASGWFSSPDFVPTAS